MDENRTGTASAAALSHLITEQDLHAYADGQLPRARRRAVEAFLSERSLSAQQAAALLRSTFDLRAVRDRIYEDDALRGEVERLMAKRAAREAEDEAKPVRKASA